MIIKAMFMHYTMILDDFKIIPLYRVSDTAKPATTHDSLTENSKRFHK